jgi:hypothetical protein
MDDASVDISASASLINIEEDSSSTTTSKSKKSIIYNYFEYKKSRYFCKYCSKDFREKSTTTLWRHINSKHSNIIIPQEKVVTGEMDKFVKSENVSIFVLNGYKNYYINI